MIHAAWSRDHSFTVAQSITGDPPATWYVTVGNGGGVRILSTPPEERRGRDRDDDPRGRSRTSSGASRPRPATGRSCAATARPWRC